MQDGSSPTESATLPLGPVAIGDRLGVIAGGGDAPKRLIAFLDREKRPYYVVALAGHADADLAANPPPLWLPLGAGATARDAMRAAGVRDLVMIGHVRRPSLLELKPDLFTLRKLMQAGFAMLGDDGVLRAIAKIVEAEGFRVVGIHEVMGDCLTPAGALGRHIPAAQDMQDIARGAAVARQLGGGDVGQSVLVQQGIVLAVEAAEGTDAMIRRAGALKRAGGGGVLVKLAKPGQDRRMDLPAIGAQTVAEMAAAGFAGIAVEAKASLLVDRDTVIAAADAAGLFLHGHEGGA